MNSRRFLDSERQHPAIRQSDQRRRSLIHEPSLLPDPLDLHLGPARPTPPGPTNINAPNADAGSSRRAKRSRAINSESVAISAQNQQRTIDRGSQPPNAITEGTNSSAQSRVAPVAPPPRIIYSCAICLGPLVEETTTNCGHIFCKDCIDNAIETLGTCPMCRRRITFRELQRVYLSDPL
ncbi:hypothetical protein M8C21_000366 [Ambrosia artemisiifolia]|uniref:RING-type domain-containing protein n=1 Tax=Ambrosia artemisiifolia TaxID=4212 RepID=A0AAD5CV95_AMBAR|nr:hypothetical protein M8C21_000366 [Ambrosia artemisiifolia]